MINVLIDTSNTELAVGISEGDKVIDFVRYDAWQRQSEYLIVKLDTLLKKHSLTRKDIANVVVSKGPGSYTGVRIGLTVAKVMAISLKIPLYCVSSLEILRKGDELSLCLVNARANRSYVGLYKGEECLIPDTIWTNDEVNAYLDEHKEVIPRGMLSYLNKKCEKTDTLGVLATSIKEKYLEKEPLKASPVYLKG